MARGVHGSGRTQLIREFLSKHCNEAFTARETRDAVEPGASVDVFSATMTSMASRGAIARLGAGTGRVHYFWPRGMATIDRRRAPGTGRSAATAKPRAAVPRAKATATTRPRRNPAAPPPTREAAKAISALAAAKRTAAPRRAESNFLAPIAITDPTFNARRAASARLAADIAEFERKGGRIECLDVTKLFTHPDDCQD
ncbi:hypothetical protein H9645_03780 [Luteimonas sp. Sa2BVA3]|uniref:Uncharacterized protein n=1 Tax=Luteimonas colneyensis TaxID=2762230 RepID=A0ABR8UGJ9_9GAMM|nr:hypothetical protein [Luteimonas colneyensis]MBD7987142.1 hypothetical protein [Luteimonas colneyensis]